MNNDYMLEPYRYGRNLECYSENPLTAIGRGNPEIGSQTMLELLEEKNRHEMAMLNRRAEIAQQQAEALVPLEMAQTVKSWLANRQGDNNFVAEYEDAQPGIFFSGVRRRITIRARSW